MIIIKESVYKALEIVAEEGEILISDLKVKYIDKIGKDFNPRIIGALCAGETPNCNLKGSRLKITEKGKENLGLPVELDDSEPATTTTKTTTAKPSKPKPKARTVKTDFVETNNEISLIIYAVDEGKNCLLSGPTGCGKSFAIEEVAKVEKKKLWTVNCDVELDKTEIVGHYEVVSDGDGNTETRWVRGILPMAMENGDWIVLDEVNMARPEVMSVLHQALDHRRTLTIKEHDNEEVKAHPDFRVFATMNPEYSGTAELNYAFRRRFEVIVDMDYLSSPKEKALIEKRTGVNSITSTRCMGIARDARKLFTDGKVSYPVSTAHLLEFASMMAKECFTAQECARVTLNISDNPDENQDILNVVRSYF